jgi:hypothetical protein
MGKMNMAENRRAIDTFKHDYMIWIAGFFSRIHPGRCIDFIE